MSEKGVGVRSMTGFGAGEASAELGRARVEVRSVNHRFLEVALNLPRLLNPHEGEIKELVAGTVRRARVDAWIAWEPRAGTGYEVVIDRELLGELARALEEARLGLELAGSVGIELLARYPEVVRIEPRRGGAADEPFALVARALAQALAELDRVRAEEGAKLVADLRARVARLRELVEAAARASEAEPQRVAERLRERVAALLGDAKLDPDRLHQEVAFLAERSDVTEEVVRLRAHLERAEALLVAGGELGKALDFLTQELGREVNTLGSKLRASEVAAHVLQMKAEIEKIREQARNLE